MTPKLERLLSRKVQILDRGDSKIYPRDGDDRKVFSGSEWCVYHDKRFVEGSVILENHAALRRAIVLATLKEAAKLVCEFCRDGHQIKENNFYHVHDPNRTCGENRCVAWAINDAIAASEAE